MRSAPVIESYSPGRAVIMGASSGIGRAAALELAKLEWAVVLAARREALLLNLAAECLKLGSPAAVPVPCDISDRSQIKRVLTAALDIPGGPIALVNAAGVAAFGQFADESWESAVAQIETNLTAMMAVCHEFIPTMLNEGSGQILNVLSVSALETFPGAAAYSASKAGALQFTRCLQAELRTKGIRVMALCPGAVDTELWPGADWVPDRRDMLTPQAVGHAIAILLNLSPDQTVDEMKLMPPKGRL